MTTWLPDLVTLSQHNGDWTTYEATVYSHFVADFVQSKPMYQGRSLSLKRHPMTNGKEATYWHIVSEGQVEANRLPSIRRCERIRWPKPIVENASAPEVKVWVARKGNENRIHIWLEQHDYLVVLADRGTYILFWTAFAIEHTHSRQKYQKAYEAYLRAQQGSP